MSSEINLRTAEEFASTWKSSPDWVMEEGVKSVYFETHRLDHNYPFFIDNNGIFVENPDNPSEKFYVRDSVDTVSYVGRVELQIFDELEELVFQNEDSTKIIKRVWFSPLYPGRYPCSKAIVHIIDCKNKTIFNLVKVFDLSAHDCVEMAKNIFPQLSGIDNPEELRSLLINPTEDSQIEQLIEMINELNKNAKRPISLLTEHELTKRSNSVVKMVRSGISPNVIAFEMNQLELLGEHSISCPTVSELLAGGFGVDKYGSREFLCPKCGGRNIRPVNQLISNCQLCGGDVRC